jgi:predicted MPP superfamily phosphohydrolase
MNIGIAHITDIHLNSTTNIENKIEKFINVINSEFAGCDGTFLVVSGDIAQSGKSEEYEIINSLSKKYFDKINIPKDKFFLILVPGNHDCNLDLESSVRKACLKNIDYETFEGSPNEIFDVALGTQADFWKFYKRYNEIPKSKIYYRVQHNLCNQVISFHCFNTAWMFQKEQKNGSLFFPINLFKNEIENQSSNFNIAVYHHPVNWLSPEKRSGNNKKEYEEILNNNMALQLIGHEHEFASINIEDLNTSKKSVLLPGQLFNGSSSHDTSGFRLVKINLESNKLYYSTYSLQGKNYIGKNWKEAEISKNSKCKLKINTSFINYFNDLKIPITINGNGAQINLDDIFVYPDLEVLDLKMSKLDEYISSEQLLNNDDNYNKIIIEGESQSGKTSLLHMLFRNYYEQGFYPLYISGKDINQAEPKRLIRKIFRKIYSEEDNSLDLYLQADKYEKILFIDDIHKTKLNKKFLKNLIEQLEDYYGRIIITSDSSHSIAFKIKSDLHNFDYFKIKEFGRKKTNDLIVNYCKQSNHEFYNIEDQDMLDKIRTTYDQVHTVIGDKIIPSYPLFILSILQSLDYKPLNLHETSYGYCYQTLIHYALVGKAKIENSDLDTYVNFLKEYAFFVFDSGRKAFDEDDLKDFYAGYSKKFVIMDFIIVRNVLLKSQVLKNINGEYCFGYRYIYYFLVAKYIAEKIDQNKAQDIVTSLFENLKDEEAANILVFITYHTKNNDFIDECLIQTMYPCEDVFPITLNINGNFYNQIDKITQEISCDILDELRDPVQEREKHLIECDANDNKAINKDYLSDRNEISEELDNIISPFHNSFRCMEIVGQIIKNRKGSISKDQLKEMIYELYNTGFRSIGYMGEFLLNSKKEIHDELFKYIKDNDEQKEIRKIVDKFIEAICLVTCLSVFSKLIYCVGVKELDFIYKEVARNIGTPAAKLVTFSINTYYNKISIKDLRSLADEFKHNPVALNLLKSRVKSYIYNNHVDYKECQQIAEILGFKIVKNSSVEYNLK